MTDRDLASPADLAEVERPDANSCGAAFLLAVRFHADELPSIAQTSLCMPDPNLWAVFADLRAWEEDASPRKPT
jgi:hypothetical protein